MCKIKFFLPLQSVFQEFLPCTTFLEKALSTNLALPNFLVIKLVPAKKLLNLGKKVNFFFNNFASIKKIYLREMLSRAICCSSLSIFLTSL